MASSFLQETFYPLGFPVCISTNSNLLLDTARSHWSCWIPAFDQPQITLHIDVTGEVTGPGDAPPAAAMFHPHRHLFSFVADSRNLIVCDTHSRSGAGWLVNQAVEDAAYFRYHFLEAAAHQLLASLYLTPIHAACVARGKRGLLLCGASEAGKSTLAYACARRGWTYVTDDASYLVRRQAAERLVVGDAHRVRLRPEAIRFFPELAAHPPAVRGNGKLTHEIRTRALSHIAANPMVNVDRIVFLHRSSGGPVRFTAFDRREFVAWCEQFFYWWDPEVASEQQANLTGLLDATEAQSLEYSDLDAAVDALER